MVTSRLGSGKGEDVFFSMSNLKVVCRTSTRRVNIAKDGLSYPTKVEPFRFRQLYSTCTTKYTYISRRFILQTHPCMHMSMRFTSMAVGVLRYWTRACYRRTRVHMILHSMCFDSVQSPAETALRDRRWCIKAAGYEFMFYHWPAQSWSPCHRLSIATTCVAPRHNHRIGCICNDFRKP